MNIVNVGDLAISNELPITILGGINVIESRDLAFQTCERFIEITEKLKMPYIFKASFDKANRSSINSFRGIGIHEGLRVLDDLKSEFNVKIISDVHEKEQVDLAKNIVDVLQLPAFLARQTDLVVAMANSGLPINIKKPQFISPHQIKNIVDKFIESGNSQLLVCERGSNFGYDNLVVDMLGFGVIKKTCENIPIIFDATHSLQTRELGSLASGGRREQLLELTRAGVSCKIAGLFIETHPNPNEAKCDGPSALKLSKLSEFLTQVKKIDELIKSLENIDLE
jgi:2-dehydro-3-deoxyphosphooctonate aldolase (KDO 8-P synthase)